MVNKNPCPECGGKMSWGAKSCASCKPKFFIMMVCKGCGITFKTYYGKHSDYHNLQCKRLHKPKKIRQTVIIGTEILEPGDFERYWVKVGNWI